MNLAQTVLIATIVIWLPACSKVNQHNYDQLEVGLSQQSVEGLLGKPELCEDESGTISCFWVDGDRSIRCSFVSDKLVLYSSEGF